MPLIRHTGIYVKDLDLMCDFYCRHFDMFVAMHEVEDNDYISTVLGVSGIKVELYKLAGKDGSMLELLKAQVMDDNIVDVQYVNIVSQGCHHMAFTVKSLSDMYKKMLSEGIKFISPPVVSSSGTAIVCFCQDPEGNYIELVEELK